LPLNITEYKSFQPLSIPDNKDSEPGDILNALEKTAGNKSRAARLLGIDRKTLYRKMERYNISGDDPNKM
jgi:transcriptional regulator of acetoin/glycerol metabolism